MEQKVTAYEFCSIHKSLSEVFVAYIGLKKNYYMYIEMTSHLTRQSEFISNLI